MQHNICKLRRSTVILQFLGKKKRFLTNHSDYDLKIWQSSLEALDLNHPHNPVNVTAQHNQNQCFHTNINRINILVYQLLHTIPYTTKSSHSWDEARQLLSNALQYYTAIWDLGLKAITCRKFWEGNSGQVEQIPFRQWSYWLASSYVTFWCPRTDRTLAQLVI